MEKTATAHKPCTITMLFPRGKGPAAPSPCATETVCQRHYSGV